MEKDYLDEIEGYLSRTDQTPLGVTEVELVKEILNEDYRNTVKMIEFDNLVNISRETRIQTGQRIHHGYWAHAWNHSYGGMVMSEHDFPSRDHPVPGLLRPGHYMEASKNLKAATHWIHISDEAYWSDNPFSLPDEDICIVILLNQDDHEVNLASRGFRYTEDCWLFPDDHPLAGRFIGIEKNCNANAVPAADGRAFRSWTKPLRDQRDRLQGLDNSNESLALVKSFNNLKSEYERVNKELADLELKIHERKRQIDDMINTYSSTIRIQTDDELRLKTMPKMLIPMAFSAARMGSGLESMLANDKRIVPGSSSFDGTRIKFSTFPFNMKAVTYPWCDDCDESGRYCGCEYDSTEKFYRIDSLRYSIDISNGYAQDHIDIRDQDEYTEGPYHPHAQYGNPCLGDAGLGIAEAWGRRDWESVVSILLAWHTTYNDESPYYPINEGYFPEVDVNQPGWVTDEIPEIRQEPEPRPEPNGAPTITSIHNFAEAASDFITIDPATFTYTNTVTGVNS